MYSPTVMDHFRNPRNSGELKDANATGQAGNPVCGDILRLYLRIEDNRIVGVAFKTFGCGAAIATSSILTEMLKGKTLEEATAITNDEVAEALGGLPPIKRHCSVLAEEALRSALNDYFSKNGVQSGREVSTVGR